MVENRPSGGGGVDSVLILHGLWKCNQDSKNKVEQTSFWNGFSTPLPPRACLPPPPPPFPCSQIWPNFPFEADRRAVGRPTLRNWKICKSSTKSKKLWNRFLFWMEVMDKCDNICYLRNLLLSECPAANIANISPQKIYIIFWQDEKGTFDHK